MKYFITYLMVILFFFGCHKETQHRDYKEKIDSSKSPIKLTEDEKKLKYSTYVVVKDRMFEDRDGFRWVKMKTDIVNKTGQDILCIKGWIVIRDDYTGDEFCKFYIDCPRDIPKNGRIEHITQEYKCDTTNMMHRTLMAMDTKEFNSWVSWQVEQVKFEDGTKLGEEVEHKNMHKVEQVEKKD